ncbi:MAG TPA: family 16 glycosylhydrolase [Paludibacter sp.]|nr:family 16 glycosylhydrolase [Paludibacter sp.]
MNKVSAIFILFLFPLFLYSQDYQLMWEDNFDNPVLNETKHWTVEVNGDGGGNNELQYYRRENISIEQHTSGVNCLVISAKRENFGSKLVTSGRLVTRGNVSAKYGKIEARIKLPSTANGLWPAFWMMGEDFSSVGWPRCGEIDILEMGNVNGISRGTQNKYFNGACHWGENWTYYAKDNTAAFSLQDDFHLFTLVWGDSNIKMYLDLDKYPNNTPYFEMSIAGQRVPGQVSNYFHKPFFVLFNLAVGGNFTGITGNANIAKITALPADGTPVKMYIDYVRIYQKGITGEEFNGPSTIVDTETPTSFTATKGAVTPNSVELLLNGTDNSGSVYYQITYGTSSNQVKGTSSVQKSHIITGLNSSTLYNFSIVAKDGNGNLAANSPIVVSATTGEAFKLATIDFETVGHDWTWVSFGNGSNAADLYAVAPNPSASGINLSLNCAKYKINVGAQSWAGIYSDNVGSITFTPDNCIVKIQVYKPFISNYMLKMENGATTFEKIVPNTLINQWEEITFDLTDKIGQTITRMTLIPDNIATRNAERICYWDNISFNSKEPNSIQNLNNYNIRLFPNPFNDHLKITAEQEISTITVRNLIGQMVMNRTANSREINLDTQEMSTGNYLVTIKLTNGEIFTQKLVK